MRKWFKTNTCFIIFAFIGCLFLIKFRSKIRLIFRAASKTTFLCLLAVQRYQKVAVLNFCGRFGTLAGFWRVPKVLQNRTGLSKSRFIDVQALTFFHHREPPRHLSRSWAPFSSFWDCFFIRNSCFLLVIQACSWARFSFICD